MSGFDHLGIAMSMVNGRPLSDALMEEVLAKLVMLDGSLNEDSLKSIRKKLEATIGIRHSTGTVMRDSDHEPWVLDAKAKIVDWHYWQSYRTMLRTSGWPEEVLNVLNEDTDNILTECGNPSLSDGWKFKGLVMGDVQSGKTASYSGLIAKAGDAGYKVIILLTGIIEDLRKQTQERLDEGFVGLNSRDVLSTEVDSKPIGAGLYRNKSANVLTSVDSDFLTNNSRALRGIPLENISEPVLFVMKKNKTSLENLLEWLKVQLKGADKHDLPLLLIDDEADNASVNARKDEDPTVINKLIRQTLDKFHRSSYVAYTATPFANIFINPDDASDLFPSNFIYRLNTPSNYIGASKIFLEEGENNHQVRDILDAEKIFPYSHKKDLKVAELPDSLLAAIRTFFICSAIRDLRKESQNHRSMLVNISRFTDVQKEIADQIARYASSLQEEVRQYLLSPLWEKHPLLLDLHQTWKNEYKDTEFSWEEIEHALHGAIASIKVLTINQLTRDEKLDYSKYKKTEKGRRVIAVGGLTLSRGLTLEGLCVTYFYRNSKAYDTLLQMGRWFGYRSEYEDLFRIWMDSTAQSWYAHIATSVEELKLDFKRMADNRQPPSRFGIRVRSHPDTLIVTAQNKMRNSQEVLHSVSFNAHGTETACIPSSGQLNEQNLASVQSFIASLGVAGKDANRYLWQAKKHDVANFLAQLNFSNMNLDFVYNPESNSKPLIDFIAYNEYEMLRDWDVCIPQGKGDILETIVVETPDGKNFIKARQRQFEKTRKSSPYLQFNKMRVGDASDEQVGMIDPQPRLAKEAWKKVLEEKGEKKLRSIPGYWYRRFRSKPLLTIHIVNPVNPDDKEGMINPDEIELKFLVAISLSFPEFDPEMKAKPIVYRLNRIAMREFFGEYQEDEEDD